jgi:hypothetical protein
MAFVDLNRRFDRNIQSWEQGQKTMAQALANALERRNQDMTYAKHMASLQDAARARTDWEGADYWAGQGDAAMNPNINYVDDKQGGYYKTTNNAGENPSDIRTPQMIEHLNRRAQNKRFLGQYGGLGALSTTLGILNAAKGAPDLPSGKIGG